MINFGGSFQAYEADQTKPFANCDDSWFVGLRSAYHPVDWPPDMQFFIWTRITHQCCYFDQSYFNKDFESFTGQTPGDYVCARQRIYAEHPEHALYLRYLSTG
jgi:AraC-like DNA-binding protein